VLSHPASQSPLPRLPEQSRIRLGQFDGPTLRSMRLTALLDSPQCFLATYADESAYEPERWQSELARGEWHVGVIDGVPVSLLGVTREPGAPSSQCHLEFLWVAPGVRRRGYALGFLREILEHVQAAGVRTVHLWVMDGNEPAIRLYQKAGFEMEGEPVPIEDQPGRTEQLFRLELPSPVSGLLQYAELA
jgi:ribosomal protein S18 acetylase RimI-like enzyme